MSAASRAPAIEMRLAYDEAANTLVITVANSGPAQAGCTVSARAYRADAPWTLTVPAQGRAGQRWLLDASGGWYDFTLSALNGADEITRRLAGRMEAGRDSISDPEMGIARRPACAKRAVSPCPQYTAGSAHAGHPSD
ncbi:DUF756 domain-containing protein [Paraburkholderia sp. A1RI-2L]|uniref:phospholipase domain-containing protein n=1 Tax=Paraburkholderia sp. A1RI-2L TaxID=3028367 RepID=UPI003B800CF2